MFRNNRDVINGEGSITTCGDVYQKWANCKDENTQECDGRFNQSSNPPTCICTQSLNIEQNMDKSVSSQKIYFALQRLSFSDFYLLSPYRLLPKSPTLCEVT